jgi:FKBP-type peptidyl-prolyl cis-trans isomerase
MPVGSKFKFTIPSNLAYGDSSPSPSIPAGATLIFEVELFNIR